MTKQHTQPCGECPFRKASIPGWLGAATPIDFMASIETDERLPCHETVNYEQSERAWRRDVKIAPQCVGAAQFRANTCKLPRDRTILRSTSSADVFGSRVDFITHHSKGRVL